MTDPDRPFPASGAWQSVLSAELPHKDPWARYEPMGVIGSGGMAEVRLAWDRQLHREVALKQPRGTSEADRLAREAQITAQLEHAGIPAVHDVGIDGDGVPWFAMRRLQGVSLRAFLQGEGRLPERVRRLRDVCHVVAYAHERGIVHRDLKPDNVVVGDHGEVFVLDWGLAREAGLRLPEDDGGYVGTPGYMGPEQWVSLAPEPSHDVWSLGAMLHEVIDGATPFADVGGDRLKLKHRVRSQDAPPLDAPGELAAILARALDRDAFGRYPEAGALADDLTRWLQGGYVEAFDYSPADLLRKAAWAWRGPLVAALAVVAVAAGFGAAGVLRVVDAEQQARAQGEALTVQQARLYAALAAEAAERGDRRTAEVLAARVLQLHESPVARGVLAAFGAVPTPQRVEALPVPACDALHRWAGDALVCVAGQGTNRSRVVGGVPGQAEPVWERDIAGQEVAGAADAPILATLSGGVQRIDAATGVVLDFVDPGAPLSRVAVSPDGTRILGLGRQAFAFEGTPLQARPIEPCASVADAVATGPSADVFGCRDGSLAVLPHGASVGRRVAIAGGLDGEPIGGLVWIDDASVLVRAGARALWAVQLADGAARKLAELPSRTRQVVVDGRLALVSTARGPVVLLHLDTGLEVASFPHGAAGALRLSGDEVVLAEGQTLHRYAVPEGAGPVRFDAPVGVFPAELSPDGRWLAAAGVDGVLRAWRTDGRAAVARALTEGGLPLKWLTFSPDGTELAVAALDASASSHRLGGPGFERLGGFWPGPEQARRVGWFDGARLVATYKRSLQVWSDGAEPELLRSTATPAHAVVADAARRFALVLDGDGQVLRFDPSTAALTPVRTFDRPRHLALAPSGRTWAVSSSDGVEVVREGREPVSFDLDGPHASLAVTDDWVLLGSLDGGVEVRRFDGALHASLALHDDVVGSLFVAADGHDVVSAAWDGEVRRWSLAGLQESGDAVARRVRATWGVSAQELVGE